MILQPRISFVICVIHIVISNL